MTLLYFTFTERQSQHAQRQDLETEAANAKFNSAIIHFIIYLWCSYCEVWEMSSTGKIYMLTLPCEETLKLYGSI